MTLAIVSNIFALVLAGLFLLAGIANLASPRALRMRYRRWRVAPGLLTVAGATQLLAALLLAIPQTRIWGGVLAAMILFATVVWLLNRGKYLYAVPAILIMVALAPAVAVSI